MLAELAMFALFILLGGCRSTGAFERLSGSLWGAGPMLVDESGEVGLAGEGSLGRYHLESGRTDYLYFQGVDQVDHLLDMTDAASRLLAVAPDGVHVGSASLDDPDLYAFDPPLQPEPALWGRLGDDLVVVVSDDAETGCTIRWFQVGQQDPVTVDLDPPSTEVSDVVIDRATGEVWLAVADSILSVAPGTDGPLSVGAAGGTARIDRDSSIDQLYIGEDNVVRATSGTGQVRWTAEVRGDVVDLAAMPALDAVLVETTLGALHLLSAASGAELAELDIPAVGGLEGAEAADTFVINLGYEVEALAVHL